MAIRAVGSRRTGYWCADIVVRGWLIADEQGAALAQLVTVTLLGGGLALCAYFGGLYPASSWLHSLRQTAPGELLKYWWWPGMAFASTYYLVAMGAAVVCRRVSRRLRWAQRP